MKINLWHLANRIKLDSKLLKQHPDQSDLLERRIKEHEANLVKCILNNIDNPKLKEITLN